MGILEEILAKQERLESEVAAQKQELAVANRILSKIPLTVSTKDAMESTGLSRHLLLKHFNPIKEGEHGNLFFRVIDLERWIAERELKAGQLTKTREAA